MITLTRGDVTVTAAHWNVADAHPVKLSQEYGRQLGGRTRHYPIVDPVWRIELVLHRLERNDQLAVLGMVGGDAVSVTIADTGRPRSAYPRAPRWHNARMAAARLVGASTRSYGPDVTAGTALTVMVESRESGMVAV